MNGYVNCSGFFYCYIVNLCKLWRDNTEGNAVVRIPYSVGGLTWLLITCSTGKTWTGDWCYCVWITLEYDLVERREKVDLSWQCCYFFYCSYIIILAILVWQVRFNIPTCTNHILWRKWVICVCHPRHKHDPPKCIITIESANSSRAGGREFTTLTYGQIDKGNLVAT